MCAVALVLYLLLKQLVLLSEWTQDLWGYHVVSSTGILAAEPLDPVD